MKRSQIFLALGALLLVGLIYLLPKVIVSKDSESKLAEAANTAGPNGETGSEGHLGTNSDVHAMANPEALKSIAALHRRLAAAGSAAERLRLSDSLGAAYSAAGKFDSAGYYYEQVAVARPTTSQLQKAADQYFQAFSFAATEARAMELGGKTRKLYEQVLKQDPANLTAKSNLAMTYVASETPMKGITMLREVLEKDPENENALYQMGILSVQSGQHEKAVERFRKLTEVNPNHVNGTFYLAVSLAESGQKAEAVEVFKRVEKMSNDPALQTSVQEYLQKLQ